MLADNIKHKFTGPLPYIPFNVGNSDSGSTYKRHICGIMVAFEYLEYGIDTPGFQLMYSAIMREGQYIKCRAQ